MLSGEITGFLHLFVLDQVAINQPKPYYSKNQRIQGTCEWITSNVIYESYF